MFNNVNQCHLSSSHWQGLFNVYTTSTIFIRNPRMTQFWNRIKFSVVTLQIRHRPSPRPNLVLISRLLMPHTQQKSTKYLRSQGRSGPAKTDWESREGTLTWGFYCGCQLGWIVGFQAGSWTWMFRISCCTNGESIQSFLSVCPDTGQNVKREEWG